MTVTHFPIYIPHNPEIDMKYEFFLVLSLIKS